jgi:uncharacterized protein (DUF488 family)
MDGKPLVLTVGHSTRPIGEFIELLTAHGVRRVVDVRAVPKSSRNPQFQRDALSQSLAEVGIGYTHMPDLGGLRRPNPDSKNTAWRNAFFRGYADYMQTPKFARAIEELLSLAKKERVAAVMCAEAMPWRCHRSLIADALFVRGIFAEDISSPTRRMPHKLTAFAFVRGINISYVRMNEPIEDLFGKGADSS